MKQTLDKAVATQVGATAPRPLMIGLTLTVVAMAVVIALAAVSTFQRDERQRMVEHTLNVQQAVMRTLSLMQDAETGQRGFMLTKDRSFLEPYTRAIAAIDAQIKEVEALVSDNADQVARVGKLRQDVATRLEIISRTIESTESGNFDGALAIMNEGQGKAAMDRVRAVAVEMQAEEAALLDQRVAEDRASGNLLRATLLVAAIVALVLGVMMFLAFRRFTAVLALSRDELHAKNQQLETEIIARRNTEAQLVQAQKMEAVGQLTGGLAHDFNNMMAVVISSLGLMRRRMASGDPNLEKFVDAAEDGAKRAATLTNRLLAFARKQPLNPEVVDANRLVSGMSELLRRTLSEHISVETVLAGGLWQSKVDPSQLENSLLNLAVNARDAMPDGGRITIETANAHLDDAYASSNIGVPPGQYVMIAVTDNGPGMPPNVLEKAFEPFFTTKPVGKGTGLGLSQVYGFVKQSEGHIKIYSELGQGTSVKIYLPRTRGAVAEAATPEPKPQAPVTKAGAIILVVEDDAQVRGVSVATLRELGYVVIHASSPVAALEKVRALPQIDLLFTDVVMPDMNGKQLADKAVELRPGLRVLFTTGYTQNAIVHNGILDPGTDLLVKPFSVEQIAHKVAQALARDERYLRSGRIRPP